MFCPRFSLLRYLIDSSFTGNKTFEILVLVCILSAYLLQQKCEFEKLSKY